VSRRSLAVFLVMVALGSAATSLANAYASEEWPFAKRVKRFEQPVDS
jgi:hypothetical protein